MTDNHRPFRNDIENKTADELIELYSNVIRRAVESKDETYIPNLNGNIKEATLRLLELGIEINAVYDEFVKENKERERREVIDLVELEHKEKLDGCERINNLLSNTKKRKKGKTNSSIITRVQQFSYGTPTRNGSSISTPTRNRRSTSDPIQSNRTISQKPKRNHSDGDSEQVESEEYEQEEDEQEEEEEDSPKIATIKVEKETSPKKRRPGRPRKKVPRMLSRIQ
jgi:hypothetical protein